MNPEEELPFASLIVPCRNEQKHIAACLDSILNNDYPRGRLEIIVVDGLSEDGTRSILESYRRKYPFIQILDNPKCYVSSAMNRGLRQAKGGIIFKMDAHADYPPDYLTQCAGFLCKTQAQNVGGKFVVRPGDQTKVAKGIALAMGHPFGGGNYYRWMHARRSPTEVETVSFGCFKKKFFDQHGLSFNENLARGEDVEINARIKRLGGKVIFTPDIQFNYYCRAGLKEFWRHQYSSGFWNVYGARYGTRLTVRALIPLTALLTLGAMTVLSTLFPQSLAVLSLLITLYLIINLGISLKLAWKQKEPVFFILMPIVFATLHLSFACGAFRGTLKKYAHAFQPQAAFAKT